MVHSYMHVKLVDVAYFMVCICGYFFTASFKCLVSYDRCACKSSTSVIIKF